MIRVGLAGIGFMGWIHYLAYQRSKSAKLVAFASRDDKKRTGDWRGIKGNFGPPGDWIDVKGIETYETLESMLASPNLDVIDICLPPHMHVETAVQALEHGKHVFCEKPLALTTQDCDRVLSAAKAAGKLVMVAQVLPYIGPYRYALEVATSGRLGKVKGGYFKRIISNPDWIPDFYESDRVGGPMVDLHVHDAHFIGLLLGKPRSVMASGWAKDGVSKFVQALYRFDDPSVGVSASCGVIDQAGRPFTHGFELYLEKATLQFEFAAVTDQAETMGLKVLHADGTVERPTLPAGDDVSAFEDEIADMCQSIQTGSTLPRLDGQLARDAIHTCLCVQQSALTGREISV